jgi:hypothetical protein
MDNSEMPRSEEKKDVEEMRPDSGSKVECGRDFETRKSGWIFYGGR